MTRQDMSFRIFIVAAQQWMDWSGPRKNGQLGGEPEQQAREEINRRRNVGKKGMVGKYSP